MKNKSYILYCVFFDFSIMKSISEFHYSNAIFSNTKKGKKSNFFFCLVYSVLPFTIFEKLGFKKRKNNYNKMYKIKKDRGKGGKSHPNKL